jgi:hypothetical protein
LHSTVVKGERWREHDAGRARAGSAAHRERTLDEVADLHAHGQGSVLASLLDRECAGEVAGHVVVAEGGEEVSAPHESLAVVVGEHPLDERRLARRIDVGGTCADCSADGRVAEGGEWPDSGDEHIGRVGDEGVDGCGRIDIGRLPCH